MLTVDGAFEAYDDGALTRSELFRHLLQMLSVVEPGPLRERLSTETGRAEEFDEWVEDVASGGDVLSSAGQSLRFTESDQAAIARFRDHARR
jgi:hypothetical protein